jgi:tetratricopeptide (TPR) repeat protein
MHCPEFPHTDRYVLRRRLGAGAIGVVFGAFDQERGIEVALKVLQRMDSEGILQMKNEFRSLAQVSHPNLVGLYELALVAQRWFFTMELVDGVDFRSWAAQPPPFAPGSARAARDDPAPGEERLRGAMRQLAQAIACVHSAGKLHHDIKPTNVLVTPAGRLVLLDFGLVRARVQPGRATAEGPKPMMLSGTPEYVAPELALGAAATPASDWYAVGAMLYEALVGRLPFEGDAAALIHQKLTRTPPDARPLVGERTRDLAHLAMRLLSRDPEHRPETPEILQELGAYERRGLVPSAATHEHERLFVGREAQLGELSDAFRASRAGAVAALVPGRSGVGKSTLCRRFLDDLERDPASPLILEARCHERESVPNKTLDGFVDALAGELARWSASERDAVAPLDRELLARMFPALRRFWPGALGTAASADAAAEARTLRRRAAAALRELVARLTRRRSLVVHIDDLQWGDADSFEILGEVLAAGNSPALWIFSYRSEDEVSSAALLAFEAMLKSCEVQVRRVNVGPLPPGDSVELVLRLLGSDDPQTRGRAEALALEGDGSPIFLSELARFERDQAAGSGAHRLTTLEDLLRARISLLMEASRHVLAVLAVAGRPLPQRLLRETADDPGAIFALLNANLARTSGTRSDDTAETYHDRIRELVISMLSPQETRRTHAELAAALQRSSELSPADLEAIAYHSLGAGDAPTALRYSLLAARQARAAYASHDSVRHFETALSLLGSPDSAQQRHEIEIEAGEACRQAGLHARALVLLTSALDAAHDATDRAAIHVSRGRVFQEKGDFRSAIAELETALRLLGRRLPGKGVRLLAATAAEIVRYGVGRLLGWSGRPPGDAALLERQANVLFLLMRIYYFVDMRKMGWAGFAAMNLCRDSNQDATRAFAEGAFGVLLLGAGLRRRAASHVDQALALAARSGSGLAEGIALGRLGGLAVFANELDEAGEVLQRSIAKLKDVSETWELLTSLMLEATASFLAGRLDAAERPWDEMATVAADMGSDMHLAWSLSWRPHIRYLRGTASADDARRDLVRAVTLSRSVGDVANQIAALSHLASISVHERDSSGAARAARGLFKVLSRYHVQVPFLQVGLVDAAEAALLGIETAPPRQRAVLRRVLRRSLRRLRRVARSYPQLRGPMLRVRALEAARAGRPDCARRLVSDAVRLLETSPNPLWLLAAYRDAADLVPDHRAELLSKADALRHELKLRPASALSART